MRASKFRNTQEIDRPGKKRRPNFILPDPAAAPSDTNVPPNITELESVMMEVSAALRFMNIIANSHRRWFGSHTDVNAYNLFQSYSSIALDLIKIQEKIRLLQTKMRDRGF